MTVDAVTKINFDTDLLEIKRWALETDEFLLVNKIEPPEEKRIKPLRGLPVYDREFYEKYRNKQSVRLFYEIVDEIEKITRENDWPLERKFNRSYCSFKYGSFNTFGIKWTGIQSFEIFIKIPKIITEQIESKGSKMVRYDDKRKESLYNIDSAKKIHELLPLFDRAVKYKITKE